MAGVAVTLSPVERNKATQSPAAAIVSATNEINRKAAAICVVTDPMRLGFGPGHRQDDRQLYGPHRLPSSPFEDNPAISAASDRSKLVTRSRSGASKESSGRSSRGSATATFVSL
jgi:hypothetical protein